MSCLSSSGSDEEEEGIEEYRKGGYHAVRVGDQFKGGRYVAQKKLGWGNYSTVWLAYDTLGNRFVAMKIQKSASEFAESAIHEIKVLSSIAEGDPSNSNCIVQLLDSFKHSGPNGQHLCLVIELLGDSLLRLIRHNNESGIGLDRVRKICVSILVALNYLHTELGMIHSDLKPENVLLTSTIDPAKDPVRSGLTPILDVGLKSREGFVNLIEKKLRRRASKTSAKIALRRNTMVRFSENRKSLEGIDLSCKIVDFGNAYPVNNQLPSEIQTRHYRAPEVILGSAYSFPVDMWSFACIAYELATGDVMFAPQSGPNYSEDEDHLALMMEVLGKMPKKIAVGGIKSRDYFDRYGDLKRIRRLKFRPINRILVEKFKFPETDASEFLEFLCPLLDFTPENRPTAAECLNHPWLKINRDTDPKTIQTKTNVENKLENNISKLRLR